MAPTQDEAERLSVWLAAPGNAVEALSPPERFLATMKLTPRMAAKAGALLFSAQLPGLLAGVRTALASLHQACSQVLCPPCLPACMLVHNYTLEEEGLPITLVCCVVS